MVLAVAIEWHYLDFFAVLKFKRARGGPATTSKWPAPPAVPENGKFLFFVTAFEVSVSDA